MYWGTLTPLDGSRMFRGHCSLGSRKLRVSEARLPPVTRGPAWANEQQGLGMVGSACPSTGNGVGKVRVKCL